MELISLKKDLERFLDKILSLLQNYASLLLKMHKRDLIKLKNHLQLDNKN